MPPWAALEWGVVLLEAAVFRPANPQRADF